MTVQELYEYLMGCCDKGFGKSSVLVCDHRDNPLSDCLCVAGVLRIEEKDGENTVVIQTT